ncbi:2-hydroxyacid dehydrogenase [Methylobacterium sp. ID0610]|uniref:2-hydroxyacid dehydrogenase n=1 Tax=Methylobacterium carpenticola TaxID=3344827 RepID=UPI0036BDF2D4
MSSRIAFVSQLAPDEEAPWLGALRAAMPGEAIAALREIPPGARAAVDIAVVANPSPDELGQLPGLRWIHSVWAGVERLVGNPAVTRLPLVRLVDPELSRTMAEAVLAWTYYLFRDMPAYAAQQRQRLWRQLPCRRPGETTIGLLGLGELGTAAAERLRHAGFRVVGWSRSEKRVAGIETASGEDGLRSVLGAADILVCLLPLTPQTRGLLDGEAFGRMRAGAALINFGRGPIVVRDDLIAALDRGPLTHAVLDVFDTEPLPASDPYWDHPKVTVLPHISAPTNMETAAGIVAQNIARYRETGTLPPTVDLARGY